MLNGFNKMSKADFCRSATAVFHFQQRLHYFRNQQQAFDFFWPCKKSTRFNRLKKVAKSIFCFPAQIPYFRNINRFL